MSENRRILYGYTVKSGRTVIEPREAGTIRRIFENYINGASLKDIAEELSANQVPFTIKNCSWDKARVARIIENSKYAGDEDHDPIIEPGIFMLAAECKKSRQKGTCGCSRVIELIGSRVKCAECGHPMLRRTVNNSVIRETWRCQNPECGKPLRECPPPKKGGNKMLIGIIGGAVALLAIIGGAIAFISIRKCILVKEIDNGLNRLQSYVCLVHDHEHQVENGQRADDTGLDNKECGG